MGTEISRVWRPSNQQVAAKIYTKKLKAELREIRLITLHAGTADQIVRVTLRSVSLNDQPQYEALSYVWGNREATRTIKVNKRSFQATTNLEAALRQFRGRYEDRTLWVDAICINQEDLAERNSQVLLMHALFGGCTKCLIWLGEPDADTQEGYRMIENMARGGHIWEWFGLSDVTRGGDFTLQDMDRIMLQYPDIFRPFRSLVNRPWWSRVWTLQEFALPPRLELFYGEVRFSWELIARASQALSYHSVNCCHRFLPPITPTDSVAMDYFCTAIPRMDDLRRTWERGKSWDLVFLLQENQYRLATVTHDKVYGFLGLATDSERESILPRYDSGVEVAFAQPAIYYIQNRKSLRVLQNVFDRKSVPNLPTWVPDWSTFPGNWLVVRWRLKMYDLFNAARGISSDGSFFENRIYKEKGFIWDKILSVGDIVAVRPGGGVNIVSVLTQWHRFLECARESMLDTVSNTLRSIAMMDCAIAFSRTSYTTVRAQPKHKAEFDILWREFVVLRKKRAATNVDFGESTEAAINILTEVVDCNTVGRRIFITHTGHVGQGPEDTRIDDEVWILAGGRMPVILRKSESTFSPPEQPADPHPCHTLISGDAFVHGIMDGEVADKLRTDPTHVYIV